ncbi:MAG TPA: hypothetical protein VF712_06310 [Thermoleophilaceae bacterium]|jgi:hypothetical protein
MSPFLSPLPIQDRYLRQLLQTGFTLTDALSSLAEMVDENNPYPGEEPAEVVLSCGAGSILPALRRFDEEEVERAIEMLYEVRERFVADLRLTCELSRRREAMRSE